MPKWWSGLSNGERATIIGTAVVGVITAAATIAGAVIQAPSGSASPQGAPPAAVASTPATTIVSPSPSTPAPTSTPSTPGPDGSEPAGARTSSGAPPPAPAAKLTTRYLSDMTMANPGDPLPGPRSINHVPFGHSIAAWVGGCPGRGAETELEYTLTDTGRTFHATVGLDDNSQDAKTSVQFDVYLDNAVAVTKTVAFGQHETIDLPLGNTIRLKLVTTFLGGTYRRTWCYTAGLAVWGDASLKP